MLMRIQDKPEVVPSRVVRVEALDIFCGVRLKPNACPLALAIGRTLGRSVDVGPDDHRQGWFVYPPRGNDPIAKLPPEAVEFAYTFDGAHPVKPFSFALEPVA